MAGKVQRIYMDPPYGVKFSSNFWASPTNTHRRFQYGWAPMAVAELTTGIWLMLFALKTQTRTDQQCTRPAIIRA